MEMTDHQVEEVAAQQTEETCGCGRPSNHRGRCVVRRSHEKPARRPRARKVAAAPLPSVVQTGLVVRLKEKLVAKRAQIDKAIAAVDALALIYPEM